MKRTTAVLMSLALGAVTLPATAPVVGAAERTVTLVGSLQDELGCPGDWQPECADTQLGVVNGGSTYAGTFDVPAGSWEFKVALDGTWDESYPADSVALTIEGPAALDFTFDLATQAVGVAPATLPGPATEADAA
ncbi:MAG: hypothetical protein GX596_07610, partial [Propionibacterium sp.]|nr:hypothetical protein [Propionibacterium sp.]